jgi:flagellar biosynthesis GTPase FlhF
MFSEIADKLYEDGSYNGWSISMPRRSTDGKRVLHHLAILGAVPPKIPGLAELAQVAVSFGEVVNGVAVDGAKDRYQFSGQIPEKEGNDTMTEDEKKAMAEKDAEISELEKENEELEEKIKCLEKEVAAKQAAAEVVAEAAEAAAETVPENKDFADMQKQISELKAARRTERLESFARDFADKVPAGIITKVKVLAERIEAVEASDFSDNGKTEKRDALWLLGEILQGWPKPVRTGASGFNYGDSADGGKPVNWAAAAKKM